MGPRHPFSKRVLPKVKIITDGRSVDVIFIYTYNQFFSSTGCGDSASCYIQLPSPGVLSVAVYTSHVSDFT